MARRPRTAVCRCAFNPALTLSKCMLEGFICHVFWIGAGAQMTLVSEASSISANLTLPASWSSAAGAYVDLHAAVITITSSSPSPSPQVLLRDCVWVQAAGWAQAAAAAAGEEADCFSDGWRHRMARCDSEPSVLHVFVHVLVHGLFG